jgi:hypothetical protein
MKVKKILIPRKPHLDPIAAIYLLRQYGQDKFPGINDAEIIFWGHSRNPTTEEMKQFEEKDTLMIDVGHGLLDHHNKKNDIEETSTSLTASYLGIEKNPELVALLSYIREDDLEGLHNRYGDLAYLVKYMHKQNIPSEQVVKKTLQILNIFQEGQKQWHGEVKKEYEAKCQLYKIKRNKKKLKIGVIESDNVQVANYGITVDNLSVVIQKRSTGHVMILTNKNHKIDLREIVAAIRKRELEAHGYKKQIDIKKLRFEGRNSQISNWFYHRSLNSFLNGSDALFKTEPTKVPFKDIVRFVLYGLTTEKSEYCDCAQGGNKCPYRDYGFSKCQRLRI